MEQIDPIWQELHRDFVDPVKAHLDSLPADALVDMRESFLETHARVTLDLERVEQALLRRNYHE